VSRPGGIGPRYAGALASGLLLWAGFPPFDQGLLAWIALVPLLWALRGASPSHGFRLGYITGLIWFALLLSWVTLFGVVTWALLAIALAVYIGTFAALLRWFAGRYRGLDLFLIPLSWTAVEVFRSVGILGFPWGLLGVSQSRILPTLQLASLGGGHFLSFLIVSGNAALITLLGRPRGAQAVGVVLVAAVLAGALGYGAQRLRTPLPQRLLGVAVLQPNISPLTKGAVETQETQLAVMRVLTEEAREAGADLIVFPETAIPVNLFGFGGLAGEVGTWAPDRVVVASSFEAVEGAIRNIAAVFEGSVFRGTYAKRRLVPFGEAGVTPGRRGAPLPTRLGSVGVSICYDSAFAELARGEAQAGAALLVVMTNDGWFGTSAGPVQHAAYSPLRAVETGRAVARAANTGISMIIDPFGRVLARLPLGRRGILAADVPRGVQTPYLRGGWFFGPATVAVALLLAASAAVPAVRSWRREPAFTRLLAALVLPGVVVVAGRHVSLGTAGASAWIVPVLTLIAAGLGAGWRGLAFRPKRAVLSLILGLLVVAALGSVMIVAYARYGFFARFAPPAAGWVVGGAALLLQALAWEGWLRGSVFTSALAWKGPGVALLLSTFLPWAVAPGGSPEVLIWSLLMGAVFGLIRWRTGDALGLAVPRAVGLYLLGTLSVL